MVPKSLELSRKPPSEHGSIGFVGTPGNNRIIMPPYLNACRIKCIYPFVISMRIPAQHDQVPDVAAPQ